MVAGGDRTGWSCPVANGQGLPVPIARGYAPYGASILKHDFARQLCRSQLLRPIRGRYIETDDHFVDGKEFLIAPRTGRVY